MIVLEGRELVLHHHEGETSYCVLTFTARDQVHLAQTTFFGENVFKKHNISAIGLTTKIDNWFINDEMEVTCSVITKVRRNHKNRIIKSFEVGNERHPYYCFLMLKKFIQNKKSGYKDIISRQYIFSILMDRLIRKNLSSTSTVVELFFRNHWISSVAESKILPVSTEYKKDLFSIMDFHGARIEYSFIDEIITGNNYFFGSRDFCSKVYAKK